MSRNLSKVARDLREKESVLLRNKILKASVNSNKTELFDNIGDADEAYQQKLARLQKFTSKVKKDVKAQTYLTEWHDEHARLDRLKHNGESAVFAVLGSVLMQDPDFDDLRRVTDDFDLNKVYLGRFKNEFVSELQELKRMLKQSSKAKQQHFKSMQVSSNKTENRTEKEETESEESLQFQAGVDAIVASTLVRMRNSQRAKSEELLKQYEELSKDVGLCTSRISKMLRDDIKGTQDAALKAEFEDILSSLPSLITSKTRLGADGEESVAATEALDYEVSLVMDHWLQKLAALDEEHDRILQRKQSEIDHFCMQLAAGGGGGEVIADTNTTTTTTSNNTISNNSSSSSSSHMVDQQPLPAAPSTSSSHNDSNINNNNNNNSNNSNTTTNNRVAANRPSSAGSVASVSSAVAAEAAAVTKADQNSNNSNNNAIKATTTTTTSTTSPTTSVTLPPPPAPAVVDTSSSYPEDAASIVTAPLGSDANTTTSHNIIASSSSSSSSSSFPSCSSSATAVLQRIMIDPNDKFGGWSEKDHEMFVKIYKKATLTGMPRKTMLTLLRGQLPKHINMDSIHLHEEWYRKMHVIHSKYKDIQNQYTVHRQDLINEAKADVKAFQQRHIQEEEHRAQLKEQEVYCLNLKALVNQLRDEKAIVTAEQMKAQAELDAKKKEERVKEEEAEKAELAARKRQVEEFKALRRAAQVQLRAQEEAAQLEAQRVAKELAEANKPKIELRAQLAQQKMQLRKQREIELEQQEEQKMELLRKLAEQVPYWEAIQNATADLSHVTASVKAQQYVQPAELGRGYIPMNGFDDNTYMHDSRHRLAMALREAGVHRSEAARVAVQQANPRPHLAIHGIL